MFRHVKVKSLKGLEECRLEWLGKINVICGKNNSGKSTILEALVDQMHRSWGVVLGDSDIERMFKYVVERDAGLRNYGEQSAFGREFKNILGSRIKHDGRVCYGDERDGIAAAVQEDFRNHRLLNQMGCPTNLVMQAFEKGVGGDRERVVLLAAKRILEGEANVKSDGGVNSDGMGILNALFVKKNSLSGSGERKFFEEVSSAFTSISSGYRFDINLKENNTLVLRFSDGRRSWIDARHCGLGLSDLIVILYFALNEEFSVVLVEEPESHMHPEMQRKLLYYLRTQIEKQFFFSTHSNVFLDSSLIDKTFIVTFDEQVVLKDVTSKAAALDELGYLVADNLVSDVVILLEGPKDAPVIEEFLIKMGLPEKFNIKTWPLGGDIMDQVDLTVLTQSLRAVALIDKDPKSSRIRKRFIEKCDAAGIVVVRLKRYAIENYFTVDAIKNAYPHQVPEGVSKIDAMIKVESQLGFSPKNMARDIARAMTLEDIKGSDFEVFLKKVELLCKGEEKKGA